MVALKTAYPTCFILIMMSFYLPLGLAACPVEGPALAPYPLKQTQHMYNSNNTEKSDKVKKK